MADNEDKENEEHAESASQPTEGSSAFDNLASGTDPSRPPEQVQNVGEANEENPGEAQDINEGELGADENYQSEDVIQQGPPPSDDEQGEGSGFAQNFENNYESDFESFDESDVYEDDFEDDFIDEEFSEAAPADFDDAIDAEFTDFDDDETGVEDDWSEGGDAPAAGSASNGLKVDGLLSNKNILYGAIGGVALLVAVGAYMTLSSGSGASVRQAGQATGQQVAVAAQSNQTQGSSEPASNSAQQQGQSLSSILDSGNIEDTSQSGTALLDNLDSLDDITGGATAATSAPVVAKPTSELPIFQERQTLSALPMPSPMENAAENDENAGSAMASVNELQQDQNTFNEDSDVFMGDGRVIQPMKTMLPNEQLASEEKANAGRDANRQEIGTLPSPFDNVEAMPAKAAQETKQALEGISREAQARVSSDRGNAKTTALKTNIEKFEEQTSTFVQRVDSIERKINNLPDTRQLEEMMARYNEMNAKVERLEGELRAAKSELRSAKANSSSSGSVAKTAARKVVKPVAKKIQWELRAASPGQAWVSKKGNTELKQVSIGDQLADLGTIRAISVQNGRWVIEASRGTIYQ